MDNVLLNAVKVVGGNTCSCMAGNELFVALLAGQKHVVRRRLIYIIFFRFIVCNIIRLVSIFVSYVLSLFIVFVLYVLVMSCMHNYSYSSSQSYILRMCMHAYIYI